MNDLEFACLELSDTEHARLFLTLEKLQESMMDSEDMELWEAISRVAEYVESSLSVREAEIEY